MQRQIITCKTCYFLVGREVHRCNSYLSGILKLFGSERVTQRRKLDPRDEENALEEEWTVYVGHTSIIYWFVYGHEHHDLSLEVVTECRDYG